MMLDARTGAVLSTTRVAPRATSLVAALPFLVSEATHRLFIAWLNSTLSHTDQAGHFLFPVCVLDTVTGALVRITYIPTDVSALALDTSGRRVYAVGGGEAVLDARTGVLLQSVPSNPLNGTDVGAATLVGGATWFIFGRQGGLRITDGATGSVLQSLPTPYAIQGTVLDSAAGVIYGYGSSMPTIPVFDAHTGAVLHTIGLGLADGEGMAPTAAMQCGRHGPIIFAGDKLNTPAVNGPYEETANQGAVAVLLSTPDATARTAGSPAAAMCWPAPCGRTWLLCSIPTPKR